MNDDLVAKRSGEAKGRMPISATDFWRSWVPLRSSESDWLVRFNVALTELQLRLFLTTLELTTPGGLRATAATAGTSATSAVSTAQIEKQVKQLLREAIGDPAELCKTRYLLYQVANQIVEGFVEIYSKVDARLRCH